MSRLIVIFPLGLYNGLDPRVRAFLMRGLGLGTLGMSSLEGLALDILDTIEACNPRVFSTPCVIP